jgi:hypothetical protein
LIATCEATGILAEVDAPVSGAKWGNRGTMTDILEIACDEAGHTGPELLDRDQRYFAYGSVALSDDEAFTIIRKARAEHPVQMPELKASTLMGSARGRRLVAALLAAMEGRYVVSIMDKLLALCGWFFEYIYEPVYQDDPYLLYDKDLHRFVAMYTYIWMTDPESHAQTTIAQFQRYMRSRNPADAPFLFDRPRPPLSREGTEHPFETILRFAYGYRDIIIADNAQLDTELPDQGRWTLDLSTSGLWSHLNFWGRKGKLLSVRCDESKPLSANVVNFTGDDNDPGIRRQRRKRNPEPLGWKLLEPVVFANSRNHPAIQLADIAAGTAVYAMGHGLPDECRAIAESLERHTHAHSIMPDYSVIDPSTRPAMVNALILYDLAKRAERHGDPYENLAEMYRLAEVGWVKGEFGKSARRKG